MLDLWGSEYKLFEGQISYGWSMCYDLCTTNYSNTDLYIMNKMASIFLVFKWHLKMGSFGIWPLLDYSKTELVGYSDSLLIDKKLMHHFWPTTYESFSVILFFIWTNATSLGRPPITNLPQFVSLIWQDSWSPHFVKSKLP